MPTASTTSADSYVPAQRREIAAGGAEAERVVVEKSARGSVLESRRRSDGRV